MRVNEACLKEDPDPGGGSVGGAVSTNKIGCGVEAGLGIAMAMAGGSELVGGAWLELQEKS